MESFYWMLCLGYLALVTGNDDPTDSGVTYKTPVINSDHLYFSESFDDHSVYKNKWVLSKAKKGQSDGTVVNYDGFWETEQAINNPLPGDYGLALKSKAKHAAISARLNRKFDFKPSTLVIQYEVTFQDGQECGGAYLKLLSDDGSLMDLAKFHDLTPYSIMFGPDKCGNDHKLHFIFRHRNPRNGTVEEKHAKKPTAKLNEYFTDAKPHLYTLILKADNTFKVLVDHSVVNEGSLLTDFTPPVNPPSEIDDPSDKEPADWDDREKIADPTATKPVDWDEDAPAMIPDPSAAMPDGWLEDEPADIKDPTAQKPNDWDVEMDGEWEAPLVPNPACQAAPGCGPWNPPKISNPNYKGKWYPPLIDNPNYKGKWTPRKVQNPDFFEDKHPYRITPIVAVGFELWSMSSNILFDNIVVTDSEEIAREWASQTFDVKKSYIEKSGDSLISRFFAYTNQNPWLWALYIVLMLIPIVLAVLFCFGTASKDRDEAALTRSKKFDETTADDEYDSVEGTSAGTADGMQSGDGDKDEAVNVDPEEEAYKDDGSEESEEDPMVSAELLVPEQDTEGDAKPDEESEQEKDVESERGQGDVVSKPEDEDPSETIPEKPASVRRRVRAD